MSRKININKYRGNTHFSVTITDSYNQEHHLGYYNDLSPEMNRVDRVLSLFLQMAVFMLPLKWYFEMKRVNTSLFITVFLLL